MEKILLAVFIILFIWNISTVRRKSKKNQKIIPSKIKVFSLGSSHAYFAYDYNNKEYCINLGEDSQSLYYDKIMLDYVYDKIEKGAVCFLTLSYFSFAGRERWKREQLIIYYKFLNLSYFKGIDKIECFIFRYLPLIWSLKKKFKKIFFKEKEISVVQRIKGHALKVKDERKNQSYNIKIIESIIKKCQNKNIKIIFVTTPFTKYYNSFFDNQILNEKFYKTIDYFRKKYKAMSQQTVDF